jgi:Tfp pilus assembly protein PilO
VKGLIESLSPRALLGIALGAVLVYALVMWLLVVSPKRSEVASAKADVAAAELRLIEAKAAENRPGGAGVPVSDVFRLAKAMPESDDQPGLVLEISRVAKASGVTLRMIAPQAAAGGAGGATMIPVAVTVGGDYFDIARFLRRIRALVTVRDGKLRAAGRLFIVQNVGLVESISDGFPMLDATVTLNAYVYDGPIVSPDAPTPEPEEGDLSTGSTAAGGTS